MVRGIWKSVFEEFEEKGDLREIIHELLINEICGDDDDLNINEIKVNSVDLLDSYKDEDGKIFEILANVDVECEVIIRPFLNVVLREFDLKPIEFKVRVRVNADIRAELVAVKDDTWRYEDCYNYYLEEIHDISYEEQTR